MKNIFNLSRSTHARLASRKPKVLVVSIPGMIEKKDLQPISDVAEMKLVISDPMSEQKLAQMCSGFDHLMLNMDAVEKKGNFKLTKSFYSNPDAADLQSICVDMTGLDYFSPHEASAAGVQLSQVEDYSTRSVAETILCEVLLHSRNRHLAYMDMVEGEDAETRKGTNLLNKRAGIVGFGNIGSEVAHLLRGVGMDVVGWNHVPKPGLEITPLKTLFSECDVICISMKTVSEGEGKNLGMINGDLLGRCRGAIIVNLANGTLVDNAAMSSAIRSGKVIGYSVQNADLKDNPSDLKKLSAHRCVHICANDAWDSDESRAILKERWVGNMLEMISSPRGSAGELVKASTRHPVRSRHL